MENERNSDIDVDGDREMSQAEMDEFLNEAFEREFNEDVGDVDGDREIPQAEMDEFLNDAFEREFNEDVSVVDDDDVEIPPVELQVVNSAFNRRIREFDLINFGHRQIRHFLLGAFNLYQSQIIETVALFNTIKIYSFFIAEFERAFVHDDDDDHSEPIFEKRIVYIPAKMKEIDSTTDSNEHFQTDVIAHVTRKVDEVMVEGSGFTLSKIIKLRVQIFKYQPLRGSGYIDLPRALKNKTSSIVNLKNANSDDCFKWAILSALHHNRKRQK